VIIIILAFLGFNIFLYLAQTTQIFSNILAAILAFFGKIFGGAALSTVKQTTAVSATGAQSAVDIVASTATAGISTVNKEVQNIPEAGSSITSSSVPGINSGKPAGQPVSTTMPQKDTTQMTTLNAALNNAEQAEKNPIDEGPYQSDDAYSSIQMSKPTSKAGWCYIGEERNFRSCSEVGENDICMSGNIFPTQDICINPSLRA
jgi:hypothetical protein